MCDKLMMSFFTCLDNFLNNDKDNKEVNEASSSKLNEFKKQISLELSHCKNHKIGI